MAHNTDHKVGFGRPPLHTRFKAGESGNPKGRPKRSRSLKEDLARELRQRVPGKDGRKLITQQRAIVRALVAKAVKGDLRAANAVVALCARMMPVSGPETEPHELSAPDQRVLEDYVDREIARRKLLSRGSTSEGGDDE